MFGKLPFWKLKREWTRLKEQAGQIEWVLLGPLRKWHQDRNRTKLVKVTEGARPLAEKVAIQLIYQPNGLLDSFIEELEFFCKSGFCVVLVSNAAISDDDINRLKPFCHLIVQRPNFGYDFGGYREGILTLIDRGIRPKHLIIKNDSIWFPLWENCSLLEDVCTTPNDMFGIYYNTFSRIPHLQSYFYYFGPRVLQDARFWDYWRSMFMTNNKYMVIRQCEMKTTRVFSRMGYSHGALYSTADVRAALSSLDDPQMNEVLEYVSEVHVGSVPQVQPLLGKFRDPGWRETVDALIATDLLFRYLMVLHPHILVERLRCPALKKDRQPIYQLQRAELFRIGADREIRPVIRNEILNWNDSPPAKGKTKAAT